MESTIQLIDLLGAASLLIWGLRMIKTGVLRAFGAVLRQWIAKGTTNRVYAAFWGFLVTLGLQSSTATAVITASFTARDIVNPRMAQAVLLGANLGTALVTLVLSMDIHWLGSVLIFVGVVLSTSAETNMPRNLGRAVLGLGLMLLALHLLSGITAPLRSSPTVVTVLSALDNAPVFAVLVAAALAVLASSSLAVVVLVMLLAGAGVVAPPLALCLVAGANLGGAIPPHLAVASEGVAARRLTLSNMIVRMLGSVLVMIFAVPLAAALQQVLPDPAQLTVGAHVGFNLALLVIFLPLIGPVARLVERVMPDRTDPTRGGPAYLDDSLLHTPDMALAVAARETLRVGDIIGEMLDRTLVTLNTSDELACTDVARLENEVDELHEAIKLYVTRLGRSELDPDDSRRAHEVISYAINLEHVGDIIESGLAEIALKKARKKLSFSAEGLAEIKDFYAHTRENLQMAQAIFLSRDPQMARRLLDQKVIIRKIEAQSAEHHLNRVRAGRVETIETSTLHLDLLRDLKRVNAHLASVAHPILEELGALRESRVR
ncbi:sodium:phosphate symporter [Cypionkella aquatica]|uniref:Sodium:phosphate symporter n=1 Tax=Cypionkella aquatica TaxID=1756042 RepID=A0AA37X0A0_9RHOB|nr:Na/Pi cotransporter family protein [Cypionkella aquatica]GLS87122.1 sodium:phosphate symporter [Cypionkella aquatica]